MVEALEKYFNDQFKPEFRKAEGKSKAAKRNKHVRDAHATLLRSSRRWP